MPIEIVPSLRTEAALVVQRIAANHPSFVDDVLKELHTCLKIRERDNARGAAVALKNLRAEINFWEKARRDSLAKTPEEPQKPLPEEPQKPLTLTEQLMGVGESYTRPSYPTELSGEDILKDYDLAGDRHFLRINKDKSRLGSVLGEYLHELSQERFRAYFEELAKGKGGDPVKRVDVSPSLLSPRFLVPDGEGPDFDQLILVVESFTVTLPNGVRVKRDFRVNKYPVLRAHPQMIKELDGNLKIRSTCKRTKDSEFSFYAKALWVNQGDLIYGYMETRSPTDTEEKYELGKYFQVTPKAMGQDITLIPVSRAEFVTLGGVTTPVSRNESLRLSLGMSL